jgi:hypothetical protein
MKTARFLILLAAVVLLFNLTVLGQTATTARITGQVTDAQGAVVGGATVKLVDKSTNQERTTTTNEEGRYAFPSLTPGTYDVVVTKQGFRRESVASVLAEVTKSVIVDVSIQPGGTAEQVTITAAGEVQLQKDDSSVGNVIDSEKISYLPSADRQITSLLTLQPGVPTSGEVTGSRADQNTFNLDGVDVSDNVIGLPFKTVVPTPNESIQEFRVTVSNPTASFGRSAGSQVELVTKRGSNQYHGSLYEYHQDASLNSNTWDNNNLGLRRPGDVDNRFGGSAGGPIWKEKIFFFFNYEGRRQAAAQQFSRLVPTDSLKSGVLKFQDATGAVVTYNPKTFDPLGIGSNAAVLAVLNRMPAPNNFSAGDGLNTAFFTANVPTSLNDDFGVLRLDYQLNSKWSVLATGRANRDIQTNAAQADLVHLKGGNVDPSRPRFLNFGVIGSPRANLVNEVRVGYAYDNEHFGAISPTTIAGFNLPVKMGPLGILDDLIDVDTQRARQQGTKSGSLQFIDNATWTKGTHTVQFGGNFRRIRTIHIRDDKVIGSVATPVAQVGSTGTFLKIGANEAPPTCGPGVTTHCLQPSDVARYNGLYSTLLGEVESVGYLATRDASLNPNTVGTPLINDTILHHWEFYTADTWKVKPSLTVSYGLAYSWHTPPVDSQGRQSVAVYKDSGKVIDPIQYLKMKQDAALQGDIFNPDIAYIPIKQSGLDGVFGIPRKDFSPRIAASWSPNYSDGFLGRILGEGKTVIRGGYAMTYDRANTVATVIIPMLGVGFAQTLTIANPTDSHGHPLRVGSGDIPLPKNTAVKSPIIPDKPFGELLSFVDDPNLKDPRNHSFAFTIQRELPHNMLVEAAYVGRLGRDLYQSYNLNSNPYFFKDKKSGQSFAQAFDGLAGQLRAGVDPTKVKAQPWFENQLGSGGTVFLASNNAGDIINGNLNNVWNFFIDFVAPDPNAPIPFNNQQLLEPFYRSNGGRSNYHALLISLHKRSSNGLAFDFNYTLSKSLDQVGAVQNSAGELASSFNPDVDYGPSFFDRTHSVNADWVYYLPFGDGQRLTAGRILNKVIGGWHVSGIFHAETGQPEIVQESAQAFGGTADFGYSVGALPNGPLPSTGVHGGVQGSGGYGTTTSTGLNLFSNPEAAAKGFRPILLSQDGRTGRGVIRGLGAWQFDMELGKTVKIRERMSFRITADFINIFNHVNFQDPFLDLQNPASFGVISQQLTDNPNGFPLAQTFYRPRVIQFGGRFQF